jgi:hypothetical protein
MRISVVSSRSSPDRVEAPKQVFEWFQLTEIRLTSSKSSTSGG